MARYRCLPGADGASQGPLCVAAVNPGVMPVLVEGHCIFFLLEMAKAAFLFTFEEQML